ncbi:MAG: hypothetical protein M5R36_04480 [Deltaproteobacteria bacterium]|nr:hypothetical protein [Deltaproteobacteria bacterium]
MHAFKARHMLALGSWADAFFLDPLVVHCNETTPLWTSALLAATSAGGHWSEPWPHLILIPFYPSLLLIVFGALRERVGQAGAAWTAVLIALTPAYGFALGGAGSHYVDVPLSVFFLGAALGVFIFLERNDAGALTVGVLLAFIAIHVKNEGLPVALAVLAPAAVRFVRSSEARARAERAIIAALLLGSTLPFHFIARSFFRTTQSQIWFHDLSAETFVQNVGRVPAILGLTGLEAANTTHWGLWWFLIIAAAVPLIVRRDRPLDTIFLIPGLVVIGSSLGIYWQDYMDFREHIAWSFDRVLLQALPGAVCFTAPARGADARGGAPNQTNHGAGRGAAEIKAHFSPQRTQRTQRRAGHRSQAAGYRLQATGYSRARTHDGGYRLQVTG